jgi:hypothetical protein
LNKIKLIVKGSVAVVRIQDSIIGLPLSSIFLLLIIYYVVVEPPIEFVCHVSWS